MRLARASGSRTRTRHSGSEHVSIQAPVTGATILDARFRTHAPKPRKIVAGLDAAQQTCKPRHGGFDGEFFLLRRFRAVITQRALQHGALIGDPAGEKALDDGRRSVACAILLTAQQHIAAGRTFDAGLKAIVATFNSTRRSEITCVPPVETARRLTIVEEKPFDDLIPSFDDPLSPLPCPNL